MTGQNLIEELGMRGWVVISQHYKPGYQSMIADHLYKFRSATVRSSSGGEYDDRPNNCRSK